MELDKIRTSTSHADTCCESTFVILSGSDMMSSCAAPQVHPVHAVSRRQLRVVPDVGSALAQHPRHCADLLHSQVGRLCLFDTILQFGWVATQPYHVCLRACCMSPQQITMQN